MPSQHMIEFIYHYSAKEIEASSYMYQLHSVEFCMVGQTFSEHLADVLIGKIGDSTVCNLVKLDC